MHSAGQYSPLTLAYMGDAVYEQCVRQRLIEQTPCPAGLLNQRAERFVSATRQSIGCDVLIPLLDEDETGVFMRARNASPSNIPKNTRRGDYHRATGLEAVFGYLFLAGKTDRIIYLFDVVYSALSE